MKFILPYCLFLMVSVWFTITASGQDAVADNMLLYQRGTGGWPKHVNDIRLDYTKPLTEFQRASVLQDRHRNDATIDNGATTKEIRHLLKAYAKTGNKTYLEGAEKGIRYLLNMQYHNGGFPQFYPDSSSYRSQITYNDNAMINALNVMWDVAYRENGFDAVNASLQRESLNALARGIDCIVKTQISVNGKLTGWCAQYDKLSLRPVKARAFELPSVSGMETVGIVEFLMKMKEPSPEVRKAVTTAVDWLESVKITGFRYQDISDFTKPGGKDRVLVADSTSAIWARFYDIETMKPFFTGRDGVKKWNVRDIEHERRTGYAWYGTWPAALLQKKYPAWKKKNNLA